MNAAKPKLMGIVNIAPDSFFHKDQFFNLEKALSLSLGMFELGADIVDIGGEPTGPSSIRISSSEEINRVIPLIKLIRESTDKILSIDTYKPEVAAIAIEAGANIINDISGCSDIRMMYVAKEFGCKIVIMHIEGDVNNMHETKKYHNGVVKHIEEWFENKIDALLHFGINESQIILDPGIGFGKNIIENYTILANWKRFKIFNLPILLGISRKSFIRNIVHKSVYDSLASTIALNSILAWDEVDILRVHDIEAHIDMLKALSVLKQQQA